MSNNGAFKHRGNSTLAIYYFYKNVSQIGIENGLSLDYILIIVFLRVTMVTYYLLSFKHMLPVEKLNRITAKNNSLVCVGLDTDMAKIPAHLRDVADPLFAFNKAIVDATHDAVCAYKPNSAFYEAHGASGIRQLEMTCTYIRQTYPDVFVILDAKRADIGYTNIGYVSFAYDQMGVDAITLHPYLGKEALQPFLDRVDKAAIILVRTSNPGAGEFQDLVSDGNELFKTVARSVAESWNANGNCMVVCGATYPDELGEVRKIIGDMTMLVPGIGAQGGDVEATVAAGLNSQGMGMIINSSRGIIFAGSGVDFADIARAETLKLRDEINRYR